MLRTFRNRHLITSDEQRMLGATRIAAFGLSVGSNLVRQLVQLGVGGAYLLGDPDRLSPTNLNRMDASIAATGMLKVDCLARQISEADPFIEQVHLPMGYRADTEAHLETYRPDLLLEEVDDLEAKARMRRWAQVNQIPLVTVSDIGEKSVVDIERHDLETVATFNGRIKPQTFQRLMDGALSAQEQKRTLINIVGARHLSARLLKSASEVGGELAGIPQLGSTAAAGAALGGVAVRAILTGEPIKSGSYAMSPRRILKLSRQSSLREAIEAVRALKAGLARPLT